MRREIIDDDVYAAVAEHGKFGDTFSDALRRALGIRLKKDAPNTAPVPRANPDRPGRGNRVTERRLSRRIEGKDLSLRFGDDPWRSWRLPASKEDTDGIRRVQEEALEFARSMGATPGQLNAVRKTFTEAGYYLTRPGTR